MQPDILNHRNWHPDFDASWLAPTAGKGPVVLERGTAPPAHVWGSVLLLGNFDGLHIGHRALLAAARRQASLMKAPLGIMSCEPHPKEFFNPTGAAFRLSGPAAKRLLCARLGIDLLFMPKFDSDFAGLSAQAFIADILAGQLGVRAVVVGQDFHFGKARSGSVIDLQAAGHVFEFETIVVPDLTLDGTRVSSTLVRQWIAAGEMEKAKTAVEDGWLVAASISEDGRLVMHQRSLLPPSGLYAVALWTMEGEALGFGKVRIGAGNEAICVEGPMPSTVLMSDWRLA